MANSTATKLPTPKNIIYDSKNDIATGRKRAVQFAGSVSVAERARLFGTQVTHSSGKKDPQTQRFPAAKQPIKSTVVPEERNYQPYKTAINRRPQQNTTYSSPERVSRDYQPPPSMQINDRPKQQSSAPNNSQNYTKSIRPSHQRRTPPPDNYYRTKIPNAQSSSKGKYTEVLEGDAYIYEANPYHRRQPSAKHNSNYFQPIQDPLQVLYQDSAQIYSQPQMSMTSNQNYNMDGVHAFNLGSLIERIQQDYSNNARPYVSSVQFIENEQALANVGIITPSTTRKNYMRRNNDMYRRRGEAHQYDIIDMKDVQPRYTKAALYDNPYSSMKRRRKPRRRVHDQASSPINIFKSPTEPKPYETPTVVPIEKPPTPVVPSPVEEEEEKYPAVIADAKPEEVETSSESEEESVITPAKPSNEPATLTPVTTRPPLPNQTPTTGIRLPAKPLPSETSETEESDSDSDSDRDDEEEAEEKPKPSPIVRLNNTRNIPTTPQANTRVPQQRPITDNTNQPPDISHSTESFDLQSMKRSSSIGGRLKSLTNKFRRKKS